MPSNSSLKKEVKTLKDARAKDAVRIAELEARLKDKEDYIPCSQAIAMVKAGYDVPGGDKSFIGDIKKTVKDKEKRKKERKKFINCLTRAEIRRWMPITYADSPYEKENSRKMVRLQKNGIKVKRRGKKNRWMKHVVEVINPLVESRRKLKHIVNGKKTYSNNVIFIKRSQYHMDKMKEKDYQIEDMNEESSTLKRKNKKQEELLKDIEYIVKKKICKTYQARCKTGSLIDHLRTLLRKFDGHAETSNFETPYYLKRYWYD